MSADLLKLAEGLAEQTDRFRHYWFGGWVLGPISGILALTAACLRALTNEGEGR